METWLVADQYLETLFESNHEEADTCMAFLHTLQKNTNAVLVSRDTDVLILLVYMYALKNIIKIVNEKFIDVGKIVEYYSYIKTSTYPRSDRLLHYVLFTWLRKN